MTNISNDPAAPARRLLNRNAGAVIAPQRPYQPTTPIMTARPAAPFPPAREWPVTEPRGWRGALLLSLACFLLAGLFFYLTRITCPPATMSGAVANLAYLFLGCISLAAGGGFLYAVFDR